MNKMITVEVAYAKPHEQCILKVTLAAGSTIAEAIQQSEICQKFPEIDLKKQKIGIFSKLKQLADLIKEGDRIEIYRPLLIDPKDARRANAKKAKSK